MLGFPWFTRSKNGKGAGISNKYCCLRGGAIATLLIAMVAQLSIPKSSAGGVKFW